MANNYDFEDSGEALTNPFRDSHTMAMRNLVNGFDSNPDDAARSIQLGQAAGVSPSAVDVDQENFEKQLKTVVSSGIVGKNPFLQSYLNADPMSAKVSHDDLTALDFFSDLVMTKGIAGVGKDAFKGFTDAFEGKGDEFAEFSKAVDASMSNVFSRTLAKGEGAAFQVGMSSIQGLTQAAAVTIGNIAKSLGMNESWANRGVRDMMALAQVSVPEVAPEVMAGRAWRHLNSYAEKGKVPPPFANPISDDLYRKAVPADVAELGEMLKAAVATQTRERSPELFKLYAEIHGLKDDVGISSDAVRALYGDKVPDPDDGVLGWVLHLQEQLSATASTGGDIRVPIADYLAKIDPAVAKQLEQFTRPRKGGMTLEEAARPVDYIEAFHGSPYEFQAFDSGAIGNGEALAAVRHAAGLDRDPLEPPEPPKPTIKIESQPTGELPLFGGEGQAPPEQKMRRPVGEQPSAKQLELPDVTRMEDRDAFEKAAAMGMTVEQYRRLQEKVEQKATEDQEWLKNRLLAEERRRNSVEAKERKVALRPEVVKEINARPEIELYDQLQNGKAALRTDSVTPEQAQVLPVKWFKSNGIHPQDLAKLYGVDDAGPLLQALTDHVAQQTASGMRPSAFRRKIIEDELDRRVASEIRKTSMAEIMDHVLSETQEEVLHETTLAAASKAGLEFPLKKDEYIAGQAEIFDQNRMGAISSEKFMADAGKAINGVVGNLLKDNPAEAFRLKQLQYNNILFARMARKLEKAQEKVDKIAETYKVRSRSNIDQEHLNWIHDILLKIGKPLERSVQDLYETIDRKAGDTQATTLKDFVEAKERNLAELPVAEFLFDKDLRTKIDNLTVPEFRDLHESLTALVTNGVAEMKLGKLGELESFQDLKGKMLDTLSRFKEKMYALETGKREGFAGTAIARLGRSGVAVHLQLETLLNRMDRFDYRGVWNQHFFRPLVEAANHEAAMERRYAKKLGEIADGADLSEKIPNPPFANPFNGSFPQHFTRKGLRTVMLNMGNDSNFHKLVAGFFKSGEEDKGLRQEEYQQYKAQVEAWVHQHATKEDWVWTQKVFDLLKEIHEESQSMYERMVGIAPESLKITPIQTPHGEFAGGYYPLIRHEVFGEAQKFNLKDLEGEGYFKATTAAGYTKKRTGAIYPLSLNLDHFPVVLKQIIHDISFREAVTNARKVVYNDEIMNAVKKHLGEENAAMFHPWLKDVANHANFAYSKEFATWESLMDSVRQNMITTLVGLNPSTVMKHTPTAFASSMAEVGPIKFLSAFSRMLGVNDETGMRHFKFATETSEELQRRFRNWVETMGGGMRYLEGEQWSPARWRDTVTRFASAPVAFGDMISAIPTWLAKYEEVYRETGVKGDAIFAADKAVRQAHGSTAITSKSAVARNQSLKWFTGFFTFFNDLLNRQIETVWRAGEAVKLAKEGKRDEALKEARIVVGRAIAYVVVPAMIEELVSPLHGADKDSFLKKAAKSLLFTVSSSWVGARDLVSYILNHRNASVGLLSTLFQTPGDVLHDFTSTKKVDPGMVIKHGATAVGVATGTMPSQVGRTGQFAYNVHTGKDKPKGPWGWLVGARYGTIKGHSPTFEKWLKGKE